MPPKRTNKKKTISYASVTLSSTGSTSVGSIPREDSLVLPILRPTTTIWTDSAKPVPTPS